MHDKFGQPPFLFCPNVAFLRDLAISDSSRVCPGHDHNILTAGPPYGRASGCEEATITLATISLNLVQMVVTTASATSRTARYYESDGRFNSSDNQMRVILKNGSANSRSRAFFRSASNTAHSKQFGDHQLQDISFLQLPPKELREQEYVLSALMANSRYAPFLNFVYA
jgi:hypothetical protein